MVCLFTIISKATCTQYLQWHHILVVDLNFDLGLLIMVQGWLFYKLKINLPHCADGN